MAIIWIISWGKASKRLMLITHDNEIKLQCHSFITLLDYNKNVKQQTGAKLYQCVYTYN